jgi:hypothetical protein
MAVDVGDRVAVRLDARSAEESRGEVRYVGPSGQQPCVVGIRLDRGRRGLGDGKRSSGERHFRCEPTHAIFASPAQCRLVARAPRRGSRAAGKENAPSPAKARAAPAPGPAPAPAPAGPFDLDAALEGIVGLAQAKDALRSLRNRLVVGRRRAALGVVDAAPSRYLLVGARGAAFGEVARCLAGLLGDLGAVGAPRVAEDGAAAWRRGAGDRDRVEKAARASAEALEARGGGVLLVRDAGDLCEDAREAAALDALCDARAARVALAVCVDAPRRAALLRAAPRLAAARPVVLELAAYSGAETAALVRRDARDRGFAVDPPDAEGRDWLERSLAQRADPGGGGGWLLARAVVDRALARQTDRVYASGTCSGGSLLGLRRADFAAADRGGGLDAALAALDGVVGLAGVKDHVRALAAQVRLDDERRRRGMAVRGDASLHCVFRGPPGTGKTTVARLLARALHCLGALERPGVVEVDRGALVAPYMGQTALKVRDAFDRARGGVLFVDEAHALVEGDRDAFGREALDALVKLSEDRRGDTVVVLAGYPGAMDALFARNPGLASRFPHAFEFEAYTPAELGAIARGVVAGRDLALGPGAGAALDAALARAPGGNGRAARNAVEAAARRMARRLGGRLRDARAVPPDELRRLLAADFLP